MSGMLGRNARRLRDSFTHVPAVRQILSAVLTIGSTYIVVAGSMAARELLTAREFGISDQLDAFLIAYVVPVFALAVAAPSFHSAIVPTFIRVREHEGHEAARQLFSDILPLIVVTLVAVAIVLGVVYPSLLPFLAARFSPAKLELTRRLFIRLLPVIVIAGANTAMTATLNATERFAVSGLIPAITPATVAVVLAMRHGRVDVFDLAHAVLIGALIEAAVATIALARARLLPRRPRLQLTPDMRAVIGQYAALVAGGALMSVTTVVDQLMAASLGSGASSALSYGAKGVNFGVGIASAVVGAAVMPYFSKMVAAADWRGLRETLRTNVLLILVATIPITIIFVVFSEPLVRLLFQRGQFNAADTLLVARVQQCFALQIPFYAAMIPLVRAISALRANHILTIAAAINLTSCIVLNWALMRVLGVPGIALSTAIVYLISFVYALVSLRRLLAKVSVAA
jgi:putative peptidoglycan lipid II flippase